MSCKGRLAVGNWCIEVFLFFYMVSFPKIKFCFFLFTTWLKEEVYSPAVTISLK